MHRAASLLLLSGLAAAVAAAAPATEPRPLAGTVTGVAAADVLDVRLASGATIRARIAGIRAPAAGACHATEALEGTRALALGNRVELSRDGTGWYVALSSGADLGRTLVSRGLAQVDAWGRPFARFASYVPAQQRAETANAGMWAACAADVSVVVAAAPNPVGVDGRVTYAVTVSNAGPLAAPATGLELRPPAGVELLSGESADGACEARDWVGSCTVRALAPHEKAHATFVGEVRRAGTLATRVAVRLVACAKAACGAAPLHDPDLKNDESAALTVATEGTPPPPGPPPPPGTPPPPPAAGVCDPSYPSVCIPPPPPDLDCADIPYRDFAAPLTVPNPDPHDLDGDEDGVGCQFNDY